MQISPATTKTAPATINPTTQVGRPASDTAALTSQAEKSNDIKTDRSREEYVGVAFALAHAAAESLFTAVIFVSVPVKHPDCETIS